MWGLEEWQATGESVEGVVVGPQGIVYLQWGVWGANIDELEWRGSKNAALGLMRAAWLS